MKILHLVHNCWPDTTGGAVRLECLAQAQARLGVEPVVLSSPFQPPADRAQSQGLERRNGISYWRCYDGRDPARFLAAKPWWERAGKAAALPAFARRIREVARRERVEVIHAHSLSYCGLAAAAAGRSLGLPVVYEVRSLIEESMEGAGRLTTGAYRLLDALACRLASHVIVLCDGLRAEYLRRGVPADRLTIAGNGAAAPQRPASRRAPAGEFVAGYIGTLAAYEGLDLLIDAVSRLAPHHPELRLRIVGDGPARPALERQVERLNLGLVVSFAGRVPREAVAYYYDCIDLLVCPRRPSRLTDLVTPLKPLEIMAYGRPLLAGDCGGHRELILDGVTGALFSDFTPAALARRIEAMMAAPQELARLGRQARQWVLEHRTWESQCRPVVALYERLLAARARRRVLLVAPAPRGVVTGGVENGVAMILRSALAARHEMRVWDRRGLGGLRQLADFLGFAAHLAARRPDVVHVKSSSGTNFFESAVYAAISRALGRRILLQIHSGEFGSWYQGQSPLGRRLIEMALRIPSGILVLSERWRQVVAPLAGAASVCVVPNGAELGTLPAAPAGNGGPLRVLTISTLGTHKGHMEILDAAARLRGHPVRFLLAGPDQTSGRGDGGLLRRRAAELGLNGAVDFLGPVGPAEKRNLLATADVFLLPSRAEGMPNVVLEAMAAGLPVIATPVGSLPEMFEGGAGCRFIPPGDAASLAKALLELLADPERRHAMGQWNRARVQAQYGFDRVERLLDELYRGD